MKNFYLRLGIAVAVIIASVICILPTFSPGIWPYKKINLGLDLQGGMHLVLEVDTNKAVDSTVERIAQEMRDLLKTNHINYTGLEIVSGRQISAKLSAEKSGDFDKILDKEFPNLRVVSRSEADGVLNLLLDLPKEETEHIKKMASAQALETIRNRIDQFGVSEPDIRTQGENRILIQLPGIKDTQRAKELIGKTALLEFKLLDETADPARAEQDGVPAGDELLYQVETDPRTHREVKTPFLVQKRTALTGAYLTDARVSIDSQYNEPHVSITFDKKGARLFEKITEENVKKRLAIVLDKRVYSAPVIQEKIAGGEARITGSFTTEEASDLAIVLRAGSLPAPVTVLEERTVGPSLGSDSIRKGLFSVTVGGLLVVIFMAMYYSTAGIIADFALFLNLLLIAAALALFQATLTMPGIAGVILTIAMAVDSNVLVFERIREELAAGRSMHSAVSAGYDRASLAILDSNVTTLIAALVLFQFGTGPVKGFAVTLSMGVISSLFTALFVTRIIFDHLLLNMRIKTLSVG